MKPNGENDGRLSMLDNDNEGESEKKSLWTSWPEWMDYVLIVLLSVGMGMMWVGLMFALVRK